MNFSISGKTSLGELWHFLRSFRFTFAILNFRNFLKISPIFPISHGPIYSTAWYSNYHCLWHLSMGFGLMIGIEAIGIPLRSANLRALPLGRGGKWFLANNSKSRPATAMWKWYHSTRNFPSFRMVPNMPGGFLFWAELFEFLWFLAGKSEFFLLFSIFHQESWKTPRYGSNYFRQRIS